MQRKRIQENIDYAEKIGLKNGETVEIEDIQSKQRTTYIVVVGNNITGELECPLSHFLVLFLSCWLIKQRIQENGIMKNVYSSILHSPFSIIYYSFSIIHSPLSVIHYPLSILHFYLFFLFFFSSRFFFWNTLYHRRDSFYVIHSLFYILDSSTYNFIIEQIKVFSTLCSWFHNLVVCGRIKYVESQRVFQLVLDSPKRSCVSTLWFVL